MTVERAGEATVKAKTLEHLRRRGTVSKQSVIATELQIPRSAIRADLAVLADEFIGIEIKSESDSLRRLSSQIGGYLSVFDHVIIVLATKHLRHLEGDIRRKVEVWELTSTAEIVELHPRKDHSPTIPLTALMTQAEKKRFSTSIVQWQPLTCLSDLQTVRLAERDDFAAAFRSRYGSTSDQFWRAVGRKAIREQHLKYLSRYHSRRHREKKWHEAQLAFWEEWRVRAAEVFGAARVVDQPES